MPQGTTSYLPYVHTMLYFHAMKNKESQFLLQGD